MAEADALGMEVVKPLERSKTRLASALAPGERGMLTLTMLEDVLDACLAQPGWETWVVSGSTEALAIASERGAQKTAARQRHRKT